MSTGNPSKFKSFENVVEKLNTNEQLDKDVDNARLYKSKDSRIKKELSFSTKKSKSKLT